MVNRFLFSIYFVTFSSLFCATQVGIKVDAAFYEQEEDGSKRAIAFLDQPFKLRVILKNVKDQPQQIEVKGIEGFERIGGVSFSTNLKIINGVMSSEYTYVYSLMPKAEGFFTLGPVLIDEREAECTCKVQIRERTESEKKTSSEKKEPQCFIKVEAGQGNMYVGQPCAISVKVYSRGAIQDIAIEPLSLGQGTCKQIGEAISYQEKIEEFIWSVTEQKYLFYPFNEGTITIPSLRASYHILPLEQKRRITNPFESMFSILTGSQTIQKITQSSPVTLTVKPLPPTDKQVDGVGNFTHYTISPSATTTSMYEPLTLTATLEGKAHFDHLPSPSLSLPFSCKTYEEQAVIEWQKGKEGESLGKKTFSFVIQPQQPGTFIIPAQSFTYFDPVIEKYKTISSKPFSITINPLSDSEPVLTQTKPNTVKEKSVSPSSSPVEIENSLAHEETETETETEKDEEKIPLSQSILLALALLSVFLFLGYKTNLISSLASWREKRRYKGAKLKAHVAAQLEKALLASNGSEIWQLCIFIIHKKDPTSPPVITQEWMRRKLSEKEWSIEKINRLMDFINTCESFSYSKNKSSSLVISRLIEEGKLWMKDLEESF